MERWGSAEEKRRTRLIPSTVISTSIPRVEGSTDSVTVSGPWDQESGMCQRIGALRVVARVCWVAMCIFGVVEVRVIVAPGFVSEKKAEGGREEVTGDGSGCHFGGVDGSWIW